MNFDIIIPCGGKGERMKYLFPNIPKQLIQVNNKEVLSWVIDCLANLPHLNTLIFVLNSEDEPIKHFLASKYPNLKYKLAYQQKPLGLLDAISVGQEFAKSAQQLIFLSDTIYLDAINTDEDNIIVQNSEVSYKYTVAILNETNTIIEFVDKPDPNIVKSKATVIGIYFFKHADFWRECIIQAIKSNIKTNNEFCIAPALNLYLKFYPIKAQFTNKWFDCGNVETFEATKKILKNQQ